MRRIARHRRDRNHKSIADALRQIPGVSVLDISQLDGTPDLLVGFRGHNVLVEIKAPGGKLRANQADFRDRWKGTVVTAHKVEDVIDVLQLRRPSTGLRVSGALEQTIRVDTRQVADLLKRHAIDQRRTR